MINKLELPADRSDRPATLYVRIKDQNKEHLKRLADQHGRSEAVIVDAILSQFFGGSGGKRRRKGG